MTEQDEMNLRQIIYMHSGRSLTGRTHKAEGAYALAPYRVGEEVPWPDLDEKGRVVDKGDPNALRLIEALPWNAPVGGPGPGLSFSLPHPLKHHTQRFGLLTIWVRKYLTIKVVGHRALVGGGRKQGTANDKGQWDE